MLTYRIKTPPGISFPGGECFFVELFQGYFEKSCAVGVDFGSEGRSGNSIFAVGPHIPNAVVHAADGDIGDVEGDIPGRIVGVKEGNVSAVFAL